MKEEFTRQTLESTAINHDWLLELLVREVEGTTDFWPITLLVDGFLVSGNLVGSNAYFQHILDTYFNEPDLEQNHLVQFFKNKITNLSSENDTVLFAHLLSVTFGNPNSSDGLPIDDNQEFRVRLDKISGFYLS